MEPGKNGKPSEIGLVSLVKQPSIVGSALMPKQANQSVLLWSLSPSVSYRNRKITTHFGVTVYVHFKTHWSTFKAVSELLKPPSNLLILKKKRKKNSGEKIWFAIWFGWRLKIYPSSCSSLCHWNSSFIFLIATVKNSLIALDEIKFCLFND